jgi:RNA polymerase sigma factor (TIGR02999 family)
MTEHNPKATADAFLPLVYDELRRLAAAKLAEESPGQTLDPTGLVHEAFLRLRDVAGFSDKTHFFRAAAESMRRILIDIARHKQTLKRGAGGHKYELAELDRIVLPDSDVLLTIDETLTKLEKDDPQSAEIARLRLFTGVSIDEAAELSGVSRATAFRNWQYARAVLTATLRDETD